MASELSGSAHELPRTPRNSTIIRKVIYTRLQQHGAARGRGAAAGAFRPLRAVTGLDLELTGLLEPAGDGATADTGHGAFIPYIVTYIGAYNVTE